MKRPITRRKFLVDSGQAAVGASALGALLAACGGSGTATTPTPVATKAITPVTLSYWCLFYAANTPTGIPIDAAVANFKKLYPQVKVNVTGWSGDQAGFTKLVQAIQGGGTVDLFRVSADELPQMVQQQLVAPTDDWLNASDKSDFYPNILQDVSVNDKHYAWPMYVPPVGMYLNLDIFKERNVDVPSDNWTYDEFVQIAQKLTFTRSDGTQVYGYTAQVDAGVLNSWPIIMCDGGTPLSADNKTYTFNSAKGVSGLQKLVDLTHKYKVTPPDFGTQTVTDIRSGFSQRKVYAMYSEPSGYASTLVTTPNLKMNFGIKPMPIGGAGKHITAGGIGLVAVAATQDQNRLNASMQLAHYLSSSQVGSVPRYYTAPPARKSVKLSAPASYFSPMVAYTWLAPMIPQWSPIRLLIQPALQKAILGQQSPKDALDGIADQVNSLLSGS